MENAAKALYIAGGVLISVLIMSALVIMWGNTSELFKTEDSVKIAKQAQAFNTEYEAFNKKLLRGTDIISVINRVENNNRSYANGKIPLTRAIKQDEMEDPGYYMNIEFEMKEAIIYKKVNGKGKPTNKEFEVGKTYSMNDFFENIKNDSDAFTDFKRRIFDCVQTKYNSNTGRINYMKFVERKMTDNEYVEGI